MVPIIPVMDLLDGLVVHAVGGRRNNYLPIKSTLTESTDPAVVAKDILAATGAERIYIADLNGIIHRRPSAALLLELQALPCRLMVDHGVRTAADVFPCDATLIAATETLRGPAVLADVRRTCSAQGIVLSVDLFEGRLLGDWRQWGLSSAASVEALVARASDEFGVLEVIVLDLACVGRRGGPAHLSILETLARRHPGLRVISGGGVRGWDDYRRLCDAGASAVLVSTALHDGTMFPRRA